MPLTDQKLRTMARVERPTKVADSDGLYLLHKPNGSKLWRYDFSFAGRRQTLALGKWPSVSLSAARHARDSARASLDAGKDPRTTRASGRDVLTFRQVGERWFTVRSGDWAKRHHEKIRTTLDRDLYPQIGDMPIDSIQPSHLLAAIRKMEARGVRELAHAARGYAGKIFRMAVAEGLCERDPSSDIRDALIPKPRTRNLAKMTADELPRFLRALDDDVDVKPRTRDAILLTILTAGRTTEIRFAHSDEFSDLDSDDALWRISAERMKMAREHLVPLSRQAREIVKRRIARIGGEGLLFGSDTRSKVISENTMLFELYRLGYRSKATMHGFRGTFSTIANESEDPLWNSDWIEMCLAHVDGGVRAAYNTARYLPQRRKLLQWWADYIDAARLRGDPKTR